MRVCRCSTFRLEKDFLARVDGTCAPRLPSLHKLPFVSFPSRKKANRMTPLPQCRPTGALAAHKPMPLRARNACPPSRLPKRHRRPSAHLATDDSSRAWFCAQAHARRAVRCRRALAGSDAVSSIKVVDVGQAADLGTPARIIGSA